MIYGIGIDLIQVKRIDQAWKRWGDRFLKRVFTEEEIAYCLRKRDPSPSLAARFAAKEACSKALGTGIRRGVHWKEIAVQRGPLGRPGLKLSGLALEICRRESIEGLFLSLTHDQEYGSAVVVLEKAE